MLEFIKSLDVEYFCWCVLENCFAIMINATENPFLKNMDL